MGDFITDKVDYQAQLTKVLDLFPRFSECFNQRSGTMSGPNHHPADLSDR